jgi:two-component system, sensor histidine kinase and response regulator
VRRLALAFNSMLAELAASDTRLRDHQRDLEHQVRSRTLELATALDVAQQAAKAKAEFLANMSHEIRTPMNGVIGMLDLLHGQVIGPEAADMLATARSSADSLLALINNVLDFSKIDAGKLHLEQIEVELLPLVEEVATLFSRQAFDKGIEMTCAVHNDVPPILVGDPTRLRQILTNLVGNAVKFTHRGEVFAGVRMRPERQAGSGDSADGTSKVIVQIIVKDTGIGMSSEVIPTLFSAFAQADASTTRRYGGTGLGLAITKELVDAMGGTIKVTSSLQEGSTFSIFLPMMVRPAAARAICGVPLGLNTLIVDDNATNRCTVRHYLENEGLRCQSAASAQEALQAIRGGGGPPFDVILIDSKMPGMDTMDFVRAIRADPTTACLPCIVLSSLGARVEEADTLRVAAWLTKPVRKGQLLEVIAGVAGGRPRARPSFVQKVAPTLYTHARVLIVEDNPVNQLVASRLLKNFGIEAQVAENGQTAVDRVQSQTFDLVLMDCQMPVMDGYEATRLIRDWEQTSLDAAKRRLPIVALTANALAGDRERCTAAGMSDYLSKPITREALGALLRLWLTPEPETLQSLPGSSTRARSSRSPTGMPEFRRHS